MTFCPIVTPGIIVAFDPTKECAPILTFPATVAPGAIWQKFSILHSCSIIAPELIIQPLPIYASALTIAPLDINVECPIVVFGEILDDGCMIFVCLHFFDSIKPKSAWVIAPVDEPYEIKKGIFVCPPASLEI